MFLYVIISFTYEWAPDLYAEILFKALTHEVNLLEWVTFKTILQAMHSNKRVLKTRELALELPLRTNGHCAEFFKVNTDFIIPMISLAFFLWLPVARIKFSTYTSTRTIKRSSGMSTWTSSKIHYCSRYLYIAGKKCYRTLIKLVIIFIFIKFHGCQQNQ